MVRMRSLASPKPYNLNPNTQVNGEDEISGKSGTRIILSLREDAEEYMDDFKLKGLIQKYSEFVNFPIRIWSQKTRFEQVMIRSKVTTPLSLSLSLSPFPLPILQKPLFYHFFSFHCSNANRVLFPDMTCRFRTRRPTRTLPRARPPR
jgi:hypothetical protein